MGTARTDSRWLYEYGSRAETTIELAGYTRPQTSIASVDFFRQTSLAPGIGRDDTTLKTRKTSAPANRSLQGQSVHPGFKM